MHVDRKESTNNAKLLLQLGDPPGWPVTCSDLAPLAVAGSTPSIADGNGGVDLVQGFTRRQLSEWPFQPVLHRLPHSASDAPAVALRVQHSKSQAPGCFHQSGHLVCIVHPEPQTGMVLGPKRSPHPKAVLSCLEEEMECQQAEFLASLSCPDVAQIR